ncbi:MAG TPA: trigger factor [Xanthobacteraceae bacterium]|nr:trigger factor [Xanthobacteraceae bacterium]
MQVTETSAAGLKREYRVVVPATDLEARVNERLDDLKGRVQLRGFRPGKVPVAHLKRLYGKSAMAEVIEAAVREANSKIVDDELKPRGEKLATEPKVVLPTEEGAVDGVINGKSDLAYTVEIEIVPPITLADFKTIKLERLTADVSDAEIDEAVQKIAEQNRPYNAKTEGAGKGDKVTMTFQGTLDGKPFEGGSGENVPIVLGAGQFIPGFEDHVIGIKAGESRTFNVTFPEQYPAPHVAGKEVTFAVTATAVDAPGTIEVNDDFAKTLGLESLARLREVVSERIQREHAAASRQKLKRALLDQLDATHKFDPPPSLVEQEFNSVWTSVEGDLKQQGRTFEDEGTTEEKAKAEYRGISERRVRLGLVIAEIGEKNNIKVTDEQLTAAVMERARQLPGQEQQVWDFYRNNPNALASLRAPLFEEKVVDFLLELADVTEKKVSREELFKEDEE